MMKQRVFTDEDLRELAEFAQLLQIPVGKASEAARALSASLGAFPRGMSKSYAGLVLAGMGEDSTTQERYKQNKVVYRDFIKQYNRKRGRL